MFKTDLSQYKGKIVAVAMSGGVDSSVTAWMLKEAGALPFGITMKTVPHSTCCLQEDIAEASKICKMLEIKHIVVNLRGLFEKKVIQYFVDETLRGKNPNPCVVCNEFVKFGALLTAAQKEGAEFMATGHYARLNYDAENKRYILRRPVDVAKDQSYVIAMMPQKILSKLIFPLGEYTKPETRALAKKAGLPLHSKAESQNLCFLNKEKGSFAEEWVKKENAPGKIINKEGKTLGVHKGIAHYTIGQRKGLKLKDKYYVTDIRPNKNEVIVGSKEELDTKVFYVKKLNWVSIKKLERPMEVEVIVRNKSHPQEAVIYPEKGKVRVETKEPIWAVSPGQIAVFLKGDICIGGGWIY